jgi:hypothetical protein
MMPVRKRRVGHSDERGFALLLVFLLASAVALMLYRQMPREAFESERDKEQMLIDRGEQYERAIKMYYLQNNRQWPAKMDDLENTNNHRYLRHRYVDPYTGKDEWRLIHTNGTFLTDSLVTPPPAQATPGATPGGATANTGSMGPSTLTSSPLGSSTNPFNTAPAPDPNAPPEVNAQVTRRPSDRSVVQNSNFQGQPSSTPPNGNDPGYQPFNPNAPISLFPNGYNAPSGNTGGVNGTGTPPGSNQPGLIPGGVNQGGVNPVGVNQPGFNQPGQNPIGVNQPGVNQPGLNQPGVPGFTLPGTNAPGTPPGVNPTGFNPAGFNQPGAVQGTIQPFQPQPFQTQQAPAQFPAQDPNQFNAPGTVPGIPNVPGNVQGFGAAPIGAPGVPGAPGTPGSAPSNAAIGLINNLLTTPRQAPTSVGQNQPQTGGGLAGVASTYKGAAIKSYADRTKYQEWEFVFQLSTQGTALQAPQGMGPNGAQKPGGLGGALGAPGSPAGQGVPGSTTTGGAAPSGATTGATSSGFGTN